MFLRYSWIEISHALARATPTDRKMYGPHQTTKIHTENAQDPIYGTPKWDTSPIPTMGFVLAQLCVAGCGSSRYKF